MRSREASMSDLKEELRLMDEQRQRLQQAEILDRESAIKTRAENAVREDKHLEAYLRELVNVAAYRTQIEFLYVKQNEVLERIAAALEKKA